ncbi:tRNA pseudouridine synthase-like 1 isoform X2 [Haliotis asinina]|uniref:tRNA pseudouridine synthase-like 1 isoform X2 n=1 Tax=Haliotis asinina TaxID=109174 RepID=UPI003531A94E
MGRYLMFLQYLGTRYSGLQVQRVGGFDRHDVKTVQGIIESHLKKLLPTWESNLCLSSRTDKKVHAICNAVHFDFHHESRLKEQSDLDRLKFILNIQLHKAKEDIKAPFDVDLFVKSAELLAGTHNFSAFTTFKGTQFKNPVKNVVIGLRGGQPDHGVCQHLEGVKCNFWDVHVQAKSFLYHQVRHMVSSMVAVARGKLRLDELRLVLEHPLDRDHMSFSAMARVSPNGLYLESVKYKPSDLEYVSNEEDRTVEGMSVADTSAMSGTERTQETVMADGGEKSVTGRTSPHARGDNRHQTDSGGDNSDNNSNNDILQKSEGKGS